MKTKAILALTLCGVVLTVIYFTRPTKIDAAAPAEVPQRLTQLFGNLAADLTLKEESSEKGKKVREYQGKNMSVATDEQGRIVKFLKTNRTLNDSNNISTDESKAIALDFVNKIAPDVDLKQFMFKHFTSNRGQGDINEFSWILNQSEFEVTSITVWSTQSGDVFGYRFANDTQPDTTVKVTKEQASAIVKEKLQKYVSPEKVQIKAVSKMVSNGTLYWYVQVILPPPTSSVGEVNQAYYVDANTGECNVR